MAKPLNAQIIGDSNGDSERFLRELQYGENEPIYVRVDTPETMSTQSATHV